MAKKSVRIMLGNDRSELKYIEVAQLFIWNFKTLFSIFVHQNLYFFLQCTAIDSLNQFICNYFSIFIAFHLTHLRIWYRFIRFIFILLPFHYLEIKTWKYSLVMIYFFSYSVSNDPLNIRITVYKITIVILFKDVEILSRT